jgi:putative ABC transport system permease protein
MPRSAIRSIGGVVPLTLRLALRNLPRHGLRTLLTLAAVALGVAGLVLAGGFIEDIFVQLGEGTIHSQLGHVQVYKKGYYANGAHRPLAYLIEKPQQVASEIAQLPEVDTTLLRLTFSGLLNNGRSDLAVLVEAGESDKESKVATFHALIDGRMLRAGDRFGIYVGEGVAKNLRLKSGQIVSVLANTRDGALNSLEFEVVGVFRSYSKEYDARVVRINLEAGNQLLDTEAVNSIVVLLQDTDATARVASRLQDRLGRADMEVKTWIELSDFYAKTVALFSRQFGFLELVILLMIVLSVLNSINLSMYERQGEFGTMRALGNRNREVFALIVMESLALGLIGSALGILIGVVLAGMISFAGIPMPPPPNAELGYIAQIRIVPGIVAGAAAIGILASTFAAVLPGIRLSRMSITDALRQIN